MNGTALVLRELIKQPQVALYDRFLQSRKVLCSRKHRLHEGIWNMFFGHESKILPPGGGAREGRRVRDCGGIVGVVGVQEALGLPVWRCWPFFAGKAEEGLLELLVDALEPLAN
jgi:hypothetical protein